MVGTPVYSRARLVHLYTAVRGWFTCTQLFKFGTPVHSGSRLVHPYTAVHSWCTCTQLFNVCTQLFKVGTPVHSRALPCGGPVWPETRRDFFNNIIVTGVKLKAFFGFSYNSRIIKHGMEDVKLS